MMNVLSIAAVALMIAGSSAFACGEEKKCDKEAKEKTACAEKKQCGKAADERTACNGKKKQCDKTAEEQSA